MISTTPAWRPEKPCYSLRKSHECNTIHANANAFLSNQNAILNFFYIPPPHIVSFVSRIFIIVILEIWEWKIHVRFVSRMDSNNPWNN
jgi:hypothetical protein